MSRPPTLTPFHALATGSAIRPGDDPIFSIHGEAMRRQKAGEDVLNASIGALIDDDGGLSVMPAVSDAFQRVPLQRAAAYAPIAGPQEFLEAVVGDLYGDRPIARTSAAVATPGGTGALYAAIVNFLEPGQKLITTSFRWGPYDTIATHTGRAVETFPMYDQRGALDLDSFEALLDEHLEQQGRALVVFNTPCHNPTGYSMDEREWARTADIVRAAGERGPVAFLLDLAYARFAPPGAAQWQRFASLIVEKATMLVAWSASKAFAQYGARVGALVASHRDEQELGLLRNALGFSCRGTWSNCNHLGMIAVAELLTDPELRARCDADRLRLTRLLDARVAAFNELAREADLRYPRYESGFFVSVFTPNAQRTAERMKELGVFVVPLHGAVRVALCSTPEAQVPRLVEALVEGVRSATV